LLILLMSKHDLEDSISADQAKLYEELGMTCQIESARENVRNDEGYGRMTETLSCYCPAR